MRHAVTLCAVFFYVSLARLLVV